MSKLICHIVDRTKGNHIGIDQYIAEKSGWNPSMGNRGMSPEKVAAFRGLYDQNSLDNNLEPLISEDNVNPTAEELDKAYDKLMNFRNGMRSRHMVTIANSKKHVAQAYDALRHAFSIHERSQRVSLVSALFSEEVDRLMGDTVNVSREAVVNGFKTTDGSTYGGAVAIFNAVHDYIMQKRQEYYEDSKDYKAAWQDIQQRIAEAKLPNAEYPEERYLLNYADAPTNAEEYRQECEKRFNNFTKVLENWNQLLPFVMRDLMKKEGVRLGIKRDYMTLASTADFGANDIAAKWDMSEAVRDGWQRNNDLESAFGSVGQQVRRVLSTIYEIESVPIFEVKNGKKIYKGMNTRPVVDGMGFRVFKNPIQVHQYLSEYLRGVQTSQDVLDRLIKPGTDEARVPWMQPLVDILTSSPQVITQMFVDFKKNFQPYSVMFEDEKESYGKLRKIKTSIINKPKNLLKSKYEVVFSSRGKYPANVKVWGFTPVFEEGAKGGKVNWMRLAELRQKVLEWTNEEKKDFAGVFSQQAQYNVSPSLLTDRRKNAVININGKNERLTYDMKRGFLMEVFTSLGYDVTVDAIDSILNSNDIYKVREQLEQLFNKDNQNTGLTYAISTHRKLFLSLTDPNVSEAKKKEAVDTLNNNYRNFKQLYNITKEAGSVPIKEHSEKLLDIIMEHQEGKRLESRARYMDNTMYSNVNPSYLGDRLEAIESLVKENDHEGLLKLISEEYLQSPFFVDNEYLATNGEKGRILNMWLSDIVDACKSKKDLSTTVAGIFNYERDLGKTDKKFEDFTIKEHGVDMLIHFFADEQLKKGYDGKGTKDVNKKMSALYPIFILGDAGVSKYIRAPRISSVVKLDIKGNEIAEGDTKTPVHKVAYRFDEAAKNRVVDAFYNLYLQERRRMELDEGLAEMYANGKKVEHPKGEFSFLTFLNPSSQEYISDYELPIDPETGKKTSDAQIVKGIIRKYLENSTLKNLKRADGTIIPSFKHRLQEMGLLETVKDSKNKDAYLALHGIATPQDIDSKLTEFYWNTKLATAMQLQLMTIDPSFYHSTKDLQKRYKEIHAPGNVLDILARDRKNNLYSVDGIERCVYFKDIAINAEESNPEFMESVLRTFALPGADVDAAIANGILKPAVTEKEKTVKRNKLIDLLGNDMVTKIYDVYMNNTLTDGQGYRTLTSYRKVMGMTGKWTEEMERAYDYIMQVRAKHEDGSDITEDEMRSISSFALVFQPIKPYMFTHEKVQVAMQKTNNEGNKLFDSNGKPIYETVTHYVPVQHKYAEALIIPELLPKGNKLRDLGLWMDAQKIDLVGSDKIAKVGCFGQSDLSAVTNTDELNTALSAGKVHELPYRDYRIQTNVPEHINSSQLFGTQVRKLIMAGLRGDHDYSFYLDGVQSINLSTDGEHNKECTLKGRNLLALYNSLICANIMESYEKFANNASNIDTLAEMLQQSTMGSMRESMDNIFSYVVTGNEKDSREFMMQLFEGSLEHDSAALLLSAFKKIVNKQQISGGSAVQVSAFGIHNYDKSGGLRYVQDPDNKANILYAEIEMPFDKSLNIDVTDKDGNTSKQKVNLSYDKYCFMDGNLKPTGEALEKGTKEWKKYQSYTYKEIDGKLVPCEYTDPEAKVYKPLIEEEYPDILSILAYRIPSENDYSMINCQIKRFTSKMAGGTLKVPSQGTSIAGFDFDIDKLYFMQREYHKKFKDSSYVESKFTDAAKKVIWKNVFEDNRELESALVKAREEAEASNSDLVSTRTLPNGMTLTKHKTTLNSYYDKVNGQELTGKTKGEIFKEKAQELGMEPTQNLVEGDKSESLEKYDFTKAPEENSRASRNNLLISLIQARLMDPDTMKQRYTPGGFENAKATARLMRELRFGDLTGMINGELVNLDTLKGRKDGATDPEPNYSVTDPYTILVYNQQNQVAGKLIGIFANQNTHNAFVSCMDKFELKEALDFCGHTNMKDLLHKDSPKAAEVSLNVSQFLAASVDAVKDPVLNFMNLNTITADSAALLARLGYNMDEIGMFLSQPVIVDICQESFNSGRNVRTIISEKLKELKKDSKGNPMSLKSLSLNNLALSIISERKSREKGEEHSKFMKDNAQSQYTVLDMFSKVLKASQDVSDFITNSKFTASNAVGSTFGALYAQQMRVSKYLAKFQENQAGKTNISYDVKITSTADGTGLMSTPIDDNENLLDYTKQAYLHHVRFNPFAYEQAMFDTNRKAIRLLSKYFPYETSLYRGMRDRMSNMVRYGSLSEDDINDIHSDLPMALLARQTASDFYGEGLHMVRNSEGRYVKSNITNREYYREQFAGDLVVALNDDPEGLGNLEIFKYLTPDSQTVQTGVKWITDDQGHRLPQILTKEVWRVTMQDVGGLDSDTKEAIKESWASLMEVDDEGNFKNPKYAEIGKDLFMYCYYQMGFKFSPISFMHLAPTAVKDNIKVERKDSIPVNYFNEGDIQWDNPDSNDVLVWSNSVPGSFERLGISDVDRTAIGELQKKTFRLNNILSQGTILDLVNAAISHPELRFKIDMDLTQEQVDLFSSESLGKDVPSNIYFSQGTKSSVDMSEVAKSYGRSRTYRQFLSEILHEDMKDLDTDDFAKQWILNHPDNARFVLDLNKTNKTLREELVKQANEATKTDRSIITFDISSLLGKDKSEDSDSDILSTFAKIKADAKGRITSATWTPCIVYNNSYYMAESGIAGGHFNENAALTMTYVKIEPMGSTKTIQYDNGKELKPSVRYQSYFGEAGEDLSHAEYKREVAPAKAESAEGEEGNTITSTPETNDSEVSLENRDSSDVSNAFDAIMHQAEEKGFGVVLKAQQEEAFDKLINEDLRSQVENSDDSLNDDVYDFVEEVMEDALGRRAWRNIDSSTKESLVSAVFDFNKNPKYLETQSQVQAEDPLKGSNEPVVLPKAVRTYMEQQIAREFIAATERIIGDKMALEDIEGMKHALTTKSDKDINDTVQDLMKACRENGVIMLDAEGNMMFGC